MPQLLAEDHAPVAVQPSGTVTFVFTDIEGSTALLDDFGQAGLDLRRPSRRGARALRSPKKR